MSEITHQDGGEPALEQPFSSPPIPEAEGERPDDPQLAARGAPNPRDALIEKMSDEANSRRLEEMAAGGVASIEDMNPEHAAQIRAEQEGEKDPFAEFMVMHNGKPHMRTKVDGEDRLVPFDRVRATIQKNEAAETRLQKASDWQKELAEREKQIAERERLLAQRAQQAPLPPAPRVADADDPDLRKEVESVVSNLFDGDEKGATAKLVSILSRGRASPQTPQVDENTIVAKAVAVVDKLASERSYKADQQKGYEQFKKDFPDLMADELLFVAVDKVTEKLEAEHPDWAPSRLMQEAGTRVREWKNGKTSLPSTPNQKDPAPVRQNGSRRAADLLWG